MLSSENSYQDYQRISKVIEIPVSLIYDCTIFDIFEEEITQDGIDKDEYHKQWEDIEERGQREDYSLKESLQALRFVDESD